MTGRENQDKVQELTNMLNTLFIQQEKITEAILETKEAVNKLTKVIPKTELVEGSGIHFGDRVEILNPNKNQFTAGRAIGVTKDHLVKVKSTTGQVIRRLLKNIKKTEL